MMKSCFLAGGLWLSVVSPLWAQSLPKLQPGMAYAQARSALMEKGWRPASQLRRFQAQPLTPVLVYLYGLGYLEVAGCSPEGWCGMEFVHSQGQRLTVITRDNYPDNDAGPLLADWYLGDERKELIR